MRKTDLETEKQKDEELEKCAKQLFLIKISNNKLINKANRFHRDAGYRDEKKSYDKNPDNEKYLEQIKNIEFSLDPSMIREAKLQEDIAATIEQVSEKKITNIELIPIKDAARKNVAKNKDTEREAQR